MSSLEGDEEDRSTIFRMILSKSKPEEFLAELDKKQRQKFLELLLAEEKQPGNGNKQN
jgi:hypothetical protein